jgi:hypothetical protein
MANDRDLKKHFLLCLKFTTVIGWRKELGDWLDNLLG